MTNTEANKGAIPPPYEGGEDGKQELGIYQSEAIEKAAQAEQENEDDGAYPYFLYGQRRSFWD